EGDQERKVKEASCTCLISDRKLLKLSLASPIISINLSMTFSVAKSGVMPFDVHSGRVESLQSVEYEFQLESVIRGQHVRRMETDVGADGISFLPRFRQTMVDHQKAIGSPEDGVPSSCVRANELGIE
ncbi:hypothetical protein E4U17_003754, partial [Claviceps sp. LM77 group G4]